MGSKVPYSSPCEHFASIAAHTSPSNVRTFWGEDHSSVVDPAEFKRCKGEFFPTTHTTIPSCVTGEIPCVCLRQRFGRTFLFSWPYAIQVEEPQGQSLSECPNTFPLGNNIVSPPIRSPAADRAGVSKSYRGSAFRRPPRNIYMFVDLIPDSHVKRAKLVCHSVVHR